MAQEGIPTFNDSVPQYCFVFPEKKAQLFPSLIEAINWDLLLKSFSLLITAYKLYLLGPKFVLIY